MLPEDEMTGRVLGISAVGRASNAECREHRAGNGEADWERRWAEMLASGSRTAPPSSTQCGS
jgi:hypothetical protein